MENFYSGGPLDPTIRRVKTIDPVLQHAPVVEIPARDPNDPMIKLGVIQAAAQKVKERMDAAPLITPKG